MIRDNAHFDRLDNWKNLSIDDIDALVSNETMSYDLEVLGEITERASRIAKAAGNRVSTAFFAIKDVRNYIFSYLMPAYSDFRKGAARELMHVGFTSKLFLKEVHDVKNKWIQKNFFDLYNFGLRSIYMQLEYTAANNLTHVNLCNHEFCDDHSLKQLKNLNIQTLSISPQYCKFLPLLTSLKELRLNSYYSSSDDVNNPIQDIPSIKEKFPNLTKIRFRTWKNIDFKKLFSGSNHIETIVCTVSNIRDIHLIEISKTCKGLRNFRLQHEGPTDKGIISLVTENSDLQKLDLSGIRVTDLSLSALIKCINLQKLILNHSRVSEKGIIELTKSCAELEKIGLVGIRMTDNGLIGIAQNCNNLRKVWLRCTGVTNSGIAELKKTYPNILVVS